MLGTIFNLMNPLDRLLIKDIATDSIHGVSGITNDPSFSQRVKHDTNKAGLGIIGIDLNTFRHISSKAPTG